ncbi:MAG: hypothetical protein LWY06_15370 [Firmicutes bacterium]|nr:hypothetical protein [Bacillota bacterium]
MTLNSRVKRFVPAVVMFLLTVMLFAGAAFAQDKSGDNSQAPADKKTTVLAVPMIVTSEFKPITKSEIAQNLEKYAEKYMPNADIIQSGDIATIGADFSIEDARKLAKDKNVDYVTWGTMAFKKSKSTVRSGPESPIFQYIVTVSGVANIKVYSAKADSIIIDQSMVQSNNTTTRALEGSAQLTKVYNECAVGCVKDLSKSLMKAVKDQESK